VTGGSSHGAYAADLGFSTAGVASSNSVSATQYGMQGGGSVGGSVLGPLFSDEIQPYEEVPRFYGVTFEEMECHLPNLLAPNVFHMLKEDDDQMRFCHC